MLKAVRSIEAGAEITVDYAKKQMDDRCRRLIGGLKSTNKSTARPREVPKEPKTPPHRDAWQNTHR